MFNTEAHKRWIVVRPDGAIDLATADEFRETVLDALEWAGTVAIDFTGAALMDSTGVSVIVAGVEHTRDHGGAPARIAGSPLRHRRWQPELSHGCYPDSLIRP